MTSRRKQVVDKWWRSLFKELVRPFGLFHEYVQFFYMKPNRVNLYERNTLISGTYAHLNCRNDKKIKSFIFRAVEDLLCLHFCTVNTLAHHRLPTWEVFLIILTLTRDLLVNFWRLVNWERKYTFLKVSVHIHSHHNMVAIQCSLMI